jgi:hypothetical protein
MCNGEAGKKGFNVQAGIAWPLSNNKPVTSKNCWVTQRGWYTDGVHVEDVQLNTQYVKKLSGYWIKVSVKSPDGDFSGYLHDSALDPYAMQMIVPVFNE